MEINMLLDLKLQEILIYYLKVCKNKKQSIHKIYKEFKNLSDKKKLKNLTEKELKRYYNMKAQIFGYKVKKFHKNSLHKKCSQITLDQLNIIINFILKL
jgi:isopropylmalate/homocitrate/citramalate synthase